MTYFSYLLFLPPFIFPSSSLFPSPMYSVCRFPFLLFCPSNFISHSLPVGLVPMSFSLRLSPFHSRPLSPACLLFIPLASSLLPAPLLASCLPLSLFSPSLFQVFHSYAARCFLHFSFRFLSLLFIPGIMFWLSLILLFVHTFSFSRLISHVSSSFAFTLSPLVFCFSLFSFHFYPSSQNFCQLHRLLILPLSLMSLPSLCFILSCFHSSFSSNHRSVLSPLLSLHLGSPHPYPDPHHKANATSSSY